MRRIVRGQKAVVSRTVYNVAPGTVQRILILQGRGIVQRQLHGGLLGLGIGLHQRTNIVAITGRIGRPGELVTQQIARPEYPGNPGLKPVNLAIIQGLSLRSSEEFGLRFTRVYVDKRLGADGSHSTDDLLRR